MIYIVNNYINNKNDSLSYQPELKLNGEFYTEGILEPTTLFYINYGFNLTTKRVNVENIDDVLFKALIPRQGNHLIRDFRDNLINYLKGFQPNINNLIKDRFNPSLILVTELK